MWLVRNLTIKHKILIIALVGGLGFAIYLAINYQVTQSNSERLGAVRSTYFPILERTDANIMHLDRLKENWKSAVTTGDEDLIEDAQETANKIHAVFQQIVEIAPSTKQDVEKLTRLFAIYFNSAKTLTIGMIEGNLAAEKIQLLANQLSKHRKTYDNELQAFRQTQYNQFNSVLENADQASRSNLLWGLVIGITIMVILGATAVAISKSITDGISKLMHAMANLSVGDLTTHINYPGNDEIGQLITYHNTCALGIRDLIDGIVKAVIQLNSTSERLLSAMNQTSDSVTQQHMETDQLAAAITEMAATVKEVARNTCEAANATQEAGGKANEGLKVVTTTGQSIQILANDVDSAAITIQSLEEDSANIGSVLDVIKTIAEQTNLLALNAAIEAARAGEQGRGFAVVADEVRNLANRTQESTQEIQATIEKLQLGSRAAANVMEKGRTQAHDSVKQSDSAGKLLNNINMAMNTITDMNTQIASAAEEQTSVAEEINKNIVSIYTLADQTASYAKESTNNASEMASLAEHLTGLVTRFKVR